LFTERNHVKVNSDTKMFSTDLTDGYVPFLHQASLLSV